MPIAGPEFTSSSQGFILASSITSKPRSSKQQAMSGRRPIKLMQVRRIMVSILPQVRSQGKLLSQKYYANYSKVHFELLPKDPPLALYLFMELFVRWEYWFFKLLQSYRSDPKRTSPSLNR